MWTLIDTHDGGVADIVGLVERQRTIEQVLADISGALTALVRTRAPATGHGELELPGGQGRRLPGCGRSTDLVAAVASGRQQGDQRQLGGADGDGGAGRDQRPAG